MIKLKTKLIYVFKDEGIVQTCIRIQEITRIKRIIFYNSFFYLWNYS
jgi:hypothetical protein